MSVDRPLPNGALRIPKLPEGVLFRDPETNVLDLCSAVEAIFGSYPTSLETPTVTRLLLAGVVKPYYEDDGCPRVYKMSGRSVWIGFSHGNSSEIATTRFQYPNAPYLVPEMLNNAPWVVAITDTHFNCGDPSWEYVNLYVTPNGLYQGYRHAQTASKLDTPKSIKDSVLRTKEYPMFGTDDEIVMVYFKRDAGYYSAQIGVRCKRGLTFSDLIKKIGLPTPTTTTTETATREPSTTATGES